MGDVELHVILTCDFLPLLGLVENRGDRSARIVGLAHVVVVFFMITWIKVTVETHWTIYVLVECALAVPGGADKKRFLRIIVVTKRLKCNC